MREIARPPLSPYGLIQESLWPNEWLILVSCCMLNCTSRRQVDRVWGEFVRRWPDASSLLAEPINNVADVIRSLGFGDRRAKNLHAMAECYLTRRWSHAKDLPGIGKYGARAWEMFCLGIVGDEDPQDHALTRYWLWRKSLRQS